MKLTRLRINLMEGEIQPTPESTKGVEHVGPVERMTAPAPAPVVPKMKDPQKVAAGLSGAAVRRVRQERLLAELRAAKEANNPRSEAVATCSAAATPAEQQQPVAKQQPMHASAADVKADWTPWLLFGGAGLATLYVLSMRTPMPPTKLTVSRAHQQKQQHAEVGPPHQTPRCAQHLKVFNPFLME